MSDDADPRDVPAAKPVPTELPFWDKRVTLGEVRGAAIHFAKTKQGKSWLLEHRDGAVLFVAWTGEWSDRGGRRGVPRAGSAGEGTAVSHSKGQRSGAEMVRAKRRKFRLYCCPIRGHYWTTCSE